MEESCLVRSPSCRRGLAARRLGRPVPTVPCPVGGDRGWPSGCSRRPEMRSRSGGKVLVLSPVRIEASIANGSEEWGAGDRVVRARSASAQLRVPGGGTGARVADSVAEWRCSSPGSSAAAFESYCRVDLRSYTWITRERSCATPARRLRQGWVMTRALWWRGSDAGSSSLAGAPVISRSVLTCGHPRSGQQLLCFSRVLCAMIWWRLNDRCRFRRAEEHTDSSRMSRGATKQSLRGSQ